LTQAVLTKLQSICSFTDYVSCLELALRCMQDRFKTILQLRSLIHVWLEQRRARGHGAAVVETVVILVEGPSVGGRSRVPGGARLDRKANWPVAQISTALGALASSRAAIRGRRTHEATRPQNSRDFRRNFGLYRTHCLLLSFPTSSTKRRFTACFHVCGGRRLI
jgi:hypothetical protein